MATPLLMPKATAVWLVDNTSLSFEQIAAFCSLHPLEVQGIADGDVAGGIMGVNPIQNGQLTREEIAAAEANPAYRMKLSDPKVRVAQQKRKGPRYTPISRRNERPNAIKWLLRSHPELKDAQIMRLAGTTKTTLQAIRERTHWNSASLSPLDPVTLGLCSQLDLDLEVARANKDRPQAAVDHGATLLSAEITTGPRPEASFSKEDVFGSKPVAPAKNEDDDIDVDSVFAKLKDLKVKE